MATDRSTKPIRPTLYRGFESEPSDEWREDYGRGGPVRSDEPERDWFFEHSAAPPRAQERMPSSRQRSTADSASPARPAPISYRGYGPKGYRPSDERLYEIVCERLTDHPSVDASNLEVEVREAAVRISGEIPTRSMKIALDGVLDTIPGVSRVQNDARVPAKRRTR